MTRPPRSGLVNRLANRAMKQVAVTAVRRRLAYDPADTGLLLVGVQPDLLGDTATTDPTVRNLARLTTLARTAGLPIVHLPVARPEPGHRIRRTPPAQRALLAGGLLTPGTAGAAIHPRVTILDEDLVMAPHGRLSAFSGTELATRLIERGVRRVVVAGARTDVEVDSTARDAVELGLQVTVVADCCTGTSPANHHASTETTLPRVVHGVLPFAGLAERLHP